MAVASSGGYGVSQRGMSLVGLMVGLLLSMLCILACFTLYKNLMTVAAEGRLENLYDGQLTSALLISQLKIQNAGYGIADADASDILTNVTAKTSSDDQITDLLWRYNDAGTLICEGIREETISLNVDGDQIQFRQLASIEASTGCNDTVALITLSYSRVNVLARWQKVGALEDYITDNNALLSFVFDTGDCSPFGMVNTASHLNLTISAPSSTTLNTTASNAQHSVSLCLANTYPS